MAGIRKRTVGSKGGGIQQLSCVDQKNVDSLNGDDEGLLWLERSDHPLLNDVILERLFEYVGRRDVKACRLVCKKWLVRTLALARATFEATITDNNRLLTNKHGTKGFVNRFGSNSLHLPFTKFRLASFDPTTGFGEKCIQLLGDTTKEIDLYGYGDQTHYIENVFALLRSFPKLEYFKMPSRLITKKALFSESKLPSLKCLKTLEVASDDPDSDSKICHSFLDQLLSGAENISSILTFNSVPDDGLSLELLKVLEKLRRESRIEILSLTHVNAELLQVIGRMVQKEGGLRLKHLSVAFGSLEETVDCWFQLIEMMNETLVSLKIMTNFLIPNQFPRMAELKLLDLDISSLNIFTINDFGNAFPALRYLRLSTEEKTELDPLYLGSSEESCPLLESLDLGLFILNLQTFQRTLNVFPNLKELEMSVGVDGAEILQKLWTHMTRLEKLNLQGALRRGNHIDSLVTGISSVGIKKIGSTKLNGLKNMTVEVRRERISGLIQEHGTFPSIGNLTNLRHLTLSLTAEGGVFKGHLSDVTGYLGVYSIKKLQYLKIHNSKISKDCSKVLVTDVGLVAWKFKSPEGLEIIPSRWRRYKDDLEWDNFPSSKFSFN